MMDPGAYCREIESYLCRRNHGHLIRIVGPAFERVRGWAEAGVPLQVVTAGIDRRLARYRAAGPRRRPLRIEFCEADVLDAFDEWRRAVGIFTAAAGEAPDAGEAGEAPDAADDSGQRVPFGRRRLSLPRHVDRILEQVSNRLAREEMPAALRAALTRLVGDLDGLRPGARGARGAARKAVIERLADVDRTLLASAREAAGSSLDDLEAAAGAELAPFRSRLEADAYRRAVGATVDRLLRDRLRLPAVRFEGEEPRS